LDPTAESTRKNLSRAVAGYVGVGFFAIWIGIRLIISLISLAGKHESRASDLAIPLVAVYLIRSVLWRRRRLANLHPTVVAFYTHETHRERRRWSRGLPAVVGLTLGTLVTFLWTVLWLQEGPVGAGLQAWGLALYLLFTAGSLAGYGVWAWRVWRARRDQT
jgi:hypothetical protein